MASKRNKLKKFKSNTIVVPATAPRNPLAMDAKTRKGGAMKSRNASRGGQRNVQRDIMEEWADDMEDCDVTGSAG